ncbi:MAG: outer membrane protein [Oceanobacter sp.]
MKALATKKLNVKALNAKTLTGLVLPAFLSVGMAAGVAAPASADSDWDANVRLKLGKKTLDDKDWGQYDKHSSFAVLMDFRLMDSPFTVAVDLHGTGDDECEDDYGSGCEDGATTAEFHLGGRYWLDTGSKWSPYAGGGLAQMHAQQPVTPGSDEHDEDSGLGWWAGAGVMYQATDHINLSYDLRYSSAGVELNGKDVDAGGVNCGLSVGYNW